MVTLNQSIPTNDKNQVEIQRWIDCYFSNFPTHKQTLIRSACELARLTGEHRSNPYGTPCFRQGLEIAMILNSLHADVDCIVAGIIAPSAEYSDLEFEDIQEHLGPSISSISKGFVKLNILSELHRSNNMEHANNLRKMLLAMVSDVSIVLLKLAERVVVMRSIKHLPDSRKIKLAEETRDIYAPLANRLGIAQLKWELEDLCFFYLENKTYKELAKQIDEKRIDRDKRILEIKQTLEDMLANENIKGTVSGRSKHIYSIYAKMQRKNSSFQEIYDASALRVIVDKTEDCYKILGLIHEKWPWIQEEFDDYVSNPKPNGYKSIHTVITGPKEKNVEIQIRTEQMHEEAEMGFAAHWVYKEGKRTETSSYEEKIMRLRNLLDWHREIAHGEEPLDDYHDPIFEDRIYVFSPNGDIIDLPQGATPLDFAYRIHSDIGHSCRGAKVNDNIVQLTQALKTGDNVSIITTKQKGPSRDWLNPNLGYLKTSRARAKVQHWFNSQTQEENLSTGRDLLEKERKRLNLIFKDNDLKPVAQKYNFKSVDGLLTALGRGTVRLSPIIAQLQKNISKDEPIVVTTHKPSVKSNSEFIIEGVDNLLTHIAKCCKPIVGEPIQGYITQGHGISIHKKSCANLLHVKSSNKERLVEVKWGGNKKSLYPTDVFIISHDRSNLLRDITSVLANEQVNLTGLKTEKNQDDVELTISLEISDLDHLSRLIDKLNSIPNIIEVTRVK